jgi:predicted dienelactone hydrolase
MQTHYLRIAAVILLTGFLGCQNRVEIQVSDARGTTPGSSTSSQQSRGESNVPEQETEQLDVGYQIIDLDFPNSDKAESLTLAVWYPTSDQPKRYSYNSRTGGKVALDGSPLSKRGPFPLLIFSHGYAGNGNSSHFFTERLAAQGWIVVCPDHHDRYSAARIRTGRNKDLDRRGLLRFTRGLQNSTPENRVQYHYRLDEIQAALDGILEHETFQELVDVDRIALGGHSFGGFTSLGLCGTIPDRHDERVKAILLFSTGAGGYLYTEEELGRVTIPSMLFMGSKESSQSRGGMTMPELSNKIHSAMPAPKYFLTIEGASHFSFNNGFVASRLADRIASGTEEHFDVIRRYSIAFLEKHVVGKEQDQLQQVDPLVSEFQREEKPSNDEAIKDSP